jgi:hypothetical protein
VIAISAQIDHVRSIVELPPIQCSRLPDGYRAVERECFGCHRDFAVFVPEDHGAGLTVELCCPYCRWDEVEVLLSTTAGSRPILVQPILRSPEEWQVRR